MVLDGGLPLWIAMGPAALIAALVAVGVYGAWRGWRGGRHVSPSGLDGGGAGGTDVGGISDSGADDDD